jgi:hypothetical protein
MAREGFQQYMVVYLSFAERGEIQAIPQPPSASQEDARRFGVSWAAHALLRAEGSTAQSLMTGSWGRGAGNDRYKREVKERLETLYAGQPIMFVLDRPSRVNEWQFSTPAYSTIVIAPPLEGSGPSYSAWASMAMYDPENVNLHDAAIVVSPAFEPVASLSRRIGRAIGGFLGLRELTDAGFLMSHEGQGDAFGTVQNVFDPARLVDSASQACTPSSFTRAQADGRILSTALAPRLFAKDKTLVLDPLYASPFLRATRSPIRSPIQGEDDCRAVGSTDHSILYECSHSTSASPECQGVAVESEDTINVCYEIVQVEVEVERAEEPPPYNYTDTGGRTDTANCHVSRSGQTVCSRELPKVLIAKPAETDNKRAERIGKCIFRSGAYRSFLTEQGKKTLTTNEPKPGEANCTSFVSDYIAAVSGPIDASSPAGHVLNVRQDRLGAKLAVWPESLSYDYDQNDYWTHIVNGEERWRGAPGAIVASGKGSYVEPKALTVGDVVYVSFRRTHGVEGHQWIVSSVTQTKKDGGVVWLDITGVGAHSKQPVGTEKWFRFTLVDGKVVKLEGMEGLTTELVVVSATRLDHRHIRPDIVEQLNCGDSPDGQ